MRTKFDSSQKWLGLFGLVSALLCATSATAAVNPTITWTPAPITYGTPLSVSQLNASADVPGSYAYSPDFGAVLNAGATTLSVIFTPFDTANYNAVTATATLNVATALATLKPDNKTKFYGTENPPLTGTLTGILPRDEGFVGFTLNVSSTKNTDPGTFTISGGLKDNVPSDPRAQNYSLSLQAATLTINRAPLKITAVNNSTIFGELIPVLTNIFESIDASGAVAITTGLSDNDQMRITFDVDLDGTTRNPGDPTGDKTAGNKTLRINKIYYVHNNNYGVYYDDTAWTHTRETNLVYHRSASNTKTDGSSATNPLRDPKVPRLNNYTAPSGGNIANNGTFTVIKRPLGLVAGTVTTPYGTAADISINTTNLLTQDQGVIVGRFDPPGTDPGEYDLLPYPVDNSSNARLNNYQPVIVAGKLIITKFPQEITNPQDPATIVYGTPVSGSHLNATNTTHKSDGTVPGPVPPPPLQYFLVGSSTPALGAILNATTALNLNTIEVRAPETPQYKGATNYYNINVQKRTPTFSWANPSAIQIGTPLSANQLNATVNTSPGITPVAGIIYSPNTGTLLDVGEKDLTVYSIETTNYTSAQATAKITVNKGPVSLTDLAAPSIPTTLTNNVTLGGKVQVGGQTAILIPAGEFVSIEVLNKNGQSLKKYDVQIAGNGTFSQVATDLDLPISGSPYTVKYLYDPPSSHPRFTTTTVNTTLTVGQLTPVFDQFSGYTNTYGTTAITLSGRIKAGDFVPNAAAITAGAARVTIQVDNRADATYTTPINADGTFTANVVLPQLNAAVYPVKYTFAAAGTFNAAETILFHLAITRAPLNASLNLDHTYGEGRFTPTGLITNNLSSQLKFGDKIVVYYDATRIDTTNTAAAPFTVYDVAPLYSDPDSRIHNYAFVLETGHIRNFPAPLTIRPKDVTIITNTPIPTSFEYDANGLKNEQTKSVISPQPIIRTTATTSTNEGVFDIYITNSPAAPNYAVTVQVGKLTITRDLPVISWTAPANISYGTSLGAAQLNASTVTIRGTNYNVSTSYTTDGPVNGGHFVNGGPFYGNNNIGYIKYSPNRGFIPPAGENQPLTATFTSINDSLTAAGYGTATKTVNLNVLKQNLLITVTPSVIGGLHGTNVTSLISSLSPSYAGFVNNENSSILSPQPTLVFTPALTTDPTANPAGNYTISYTGAGAANYSITYFPGTLIITNVAVKLTWNDSTLSYGEAIHYGANVLAPTVEPAIPGSFTYDPAEGTKMTAGDRTLTATFHPTDTATYGNNHVVTKKLTVSPAQLRISINYTTNRVYGDEGPALPALPTNYVALYSGSGVPEVGLSTNGANNVTYIRFPGSSIANVVVTGFVEGERWTNFNPSLIAFNPGSNAPVVPQTQIGVYPIRLSAIPNYQNVYETHTLTTTAEGALTITRAPLTNTAINLTVVYGNTNITTLIGNSGTLVGVKAGDNITPEYTSPVDFRSPVGSSYLITPNLRDPNNRLGNYQPVQNSAVLTISPATLQVKVDPKSKKPNTANPKATAIISGFLNDLQNSITYEQGANNNIITVPGSNAVPSLTITAPTLVISSAPNSQPGVQPVTYPITASGGFAGQNYQYTYVNSLLTETPNRAPVARPDTFSVTVADVTKISKSKMLINDSDPDGDALTVSGFSSSTPKGGTVGTDNTGLWLFYQPFQGATNNDTDTFTYTVNDGFGLTATATVTVRIQANTANAIPRNIVSAKQNDDGSIFMRFIGITGPNRHYRIQASTTFMNPNWQDLPLNDDTVDQSVNLLGPNGSYMLASPAGFIEYTDIDAQTSSRFYRAVLVP